MSFILHTPQETLLKIAEQAKQSRLNMNLSQEGLAKRSGVSLASLKRFEKTGRISLESLLKLALVLGTLENFQTIFQKHPHTGLSLDAILKTPKTRKRGRTK